MSIHVEFPEELLVTSREAPRVFTRKVILHIASSLPLCISWTQRGKPCKFVGGMALGSTESRH
jgi:hypothetical protein